MTFFFLSTLFVANVVLSLAFTPPQATLSTGSFLLDHLNLNHERGRHDLLRAFYFDTLGLVLDQRKQENADKGRKTLWANAGITQFHLPEADKAQIFDGIITLSCTDADPESFNALLDRLSKPPSVLSDNSLFSSLLLSDTSVGVRDPWGNLFVIKRDSSALDPRGQQPGTQGACIGLVMSDLQVNLPRTGPGGKSAEELLLGVARFYQEVFSVPLIDKSVDKVSLSVSPYQTLSFKRPPGGKESEKDLAQVLHDAYISDAKAKGRGKDKEKDKPLPDPHEAVELDPASGKIVANSGPHVSMYINDFSAAYRRAEKLGALFTNTRFKRQAFSLQDAQEQSMFRTLDIVDPLDPVAGPILRLEHECRSVLGKDGKSLYKSCPFDQVPFGVTL